ncbi:MAG: MBL fold metallo-hydrolase [Promethearchaeota archaeon]
MRVTFLGTAGSIMSATRSYPSILVNNDLLLDCGEGTTQKLIQIGAIKSIKIICLTHLHCDHFIGIFSLLWYYFISNREEELRIYGPPNTQKTIENIITLINTPESIKSFKIKFQEWKDVDYTQSFKFGEYIITSKKANHIPIAFAYRIDDDERVFSYTGDTSPEENLIELFKDSYLLVHEASLPSSMSDIAHQIHHSTPIDAAEIALKAKCFKLALIHISTFFSHLIPEFKKDAEEVFLKKVIIADDLMTIDF